MKKDKDIEKSSVKKQINQIRDHVWMILLSALLPFLFLVVAFVMQANTTDEKLLGVAIFLFAAGVSFLATKLALYTIIERYLNLIEELDDAKSDFISVASHQLKSPVSSLKYTVDVFGDALEERDWETMDKFSSDIESSINRLEGLTHKLLDVARAEAGRLEGEKQTFSLEEKLDVIIDEFTPLADKEDLSLSTTYNIDKALSVTIDPSFLYNVVENLLTNAIDYAPSNTSVSVGVVREGAAVKISVSNVAESIEPNDLKDIFDKFNHDKRRNKKKSVGGSGLGLFIAKSYVENWGGNISVRLTNDQNKQRVIFDFTIPPDLLS